MSIKVISQNKKARFDYEVIETFEAGLSLMGSEVKSLRNGQVNLKDSYIAFKGDEAYLQKAHISEYKYSSYNNHHPERMRKLLLNRIELNKIMGSLKEKGYSCVPLKIYFKRGKVKLEIALARGKKHHDKRQTIKKRAADRELAQKLKREKN